MIGITRRHFLKNIALSTLAVSIPSINLLARPQTKMKLGLVTYLWGKDWDVPTIIRNCEKSGVLGVELRTEHAHGVEPSLNANQRKEVKKRFADSEVELVGYGGNEEFDSPDPAVLKKNIERTKELIILMQDVGGSGVKVKPNKFHEGVPKEKTLEQIGRSLNEVGKFAAEYDQQIRLEVHGEGTQELPNIKRIMDVADHPNVTVCWNSNPEDLHGKGLEYNFNLVKDRFGDTVHVRELNMNDYPYQKLMNLFNDIDYDGWILLECRTDPEDKVKAMIEQREVWKKMVS
ncbi:hypothetical protein BH23BAC1_BH23BAC1_33430 [soil metagenome]